MYLSGINAQFQKHSRTGILIYSIGLGMIGGGYPIVWAQQIAKEYPIHIRNLAEQYSLCLRAGFQYSFQSFISGWLVVKGAFVSNAIITTIIVFVLALSSIIFSFGKKHLQRRLILEK